MYSRHAPVATLRFTCRNIRNGTGRAENDGDYATLFSDNAVTSRDARGGDLICENTVRVGKVEDDSCSVTGICCHRVSLPREG